MMQPQGKCVQCLEKTNTGVTVVARRVSIKLSISKGRLWNPEMCWTAMWICKSRELQTYPRKTFSTLPSLFPPSMLPQLPSPGPFPIWELEALLLSWHHWFGATRIPWEEASCPRLHRLWGFPFLSAWSVVAASSSFHQESTVHHMKKRYPRTQASIWETCTWYSRCPLSYP